MKTHNRFPSALARAFTLVEVLFVIVFLGILAAIIIPEFTQATIDAQNTLYLNNNTVIRNLDAVEVGKFDSAAKSAIEPGIYFIQLRLSPDESVREFGFTKAITTSPEWWEPLKLSPTERCFEKLNLVVRLKAKRDTPEYDKLVLESVGVGASKK